MKKTMIKGIAVGVSTVTLLSGVPMTTPASAAEAKEEATYGEYKPFVPSVFREEAAKPVVIPQGHAYIPKDTILNVELEQELTSKKARKGDIVKFKTLENIIINDVVVIPVGTEVDGVVTQATSSGLFGRAGKLEVAITSVKSINGVKIPLEYTSLKEAGSDDGAVAVAAVVSIIGGLFMKGKNVSFPAGTKMAAKVTEDTDLNVLLENLAEEMNPEKPHGTVITLK